MKFILKALLSCILIFNASALFANETTWVTIMRSDGIMIPFALFKDGKWVNSWPETGSADASLKLEKLSDIPKKWLSNSSFVPSKWFMTNNKGIKHTLNALKPVKYSAHCEGNWGLLTDYPSPVESEYATIPKVGIALNKDSKAYAAVILSPESQNKEVVSVIEREFNRIEALEIVKEKNKGPQESSIISYIGHPVNPSLRNKISIKISEMYQIDIKHTGDSYYFFIATRSYIKPQGHPDQECEAISFFNGVITHKKGSNYKLHQGHLDLTDCDMKYVGSSTPLGIIKIQNNYYLVQENMGYESESYSIIEIKGNKFEKVFHLFGGGC